MDQPNVAPEGVSETGAGPLRPGKPVKDLLDRAWDFFASVRVVTVIIFLIAVASVVGTLIDQEGQYNSWVSPAQYYPQRYGQVLGPLLYRIGLTRMYASWWYLSLLLLLGISLVVCSLERFIPLWRTVQRPNTSPPEAFIQHLRHRFAFRPPNGEPPLALLTRELRARRYHVVQEGSRLYADKGRWGRWGPYVTHIGLLLILLGAMARAIPGASFDQMIWVRDGATVKVQDANWYVRSEKFTAEYYADGTPKSYRTDAVVIDDGKEVKRHTIAMNDPLWYQWVELYQSSFQQEVGKARVVLTERQTGKRLGTFQLDLIQPESSYSVGDYSLNVKEYFPDFGFDQAGKPVSKSAQVQNPAFIFEVVPREGKPFKQWFFALFPEMEFDAKSPVRLQVLDTEVVSTTGLKLKKDLGIPVIYLGLFVTALGVMCSFYIAHRRYWALFDGERVVLGGWTNRNETSLQSELDVLGARLNQEPISHKNPSKGEER